MTAYDRYLRCLSTSQPRKCPTMFKRHYLIGYIAYYPAVLQNGSLETYIQSVLNTPFNTSMIRFTAWITGDPRVYSYDKGKNSSLIEICNFETEQTCYKSNSLEIYCSGEKIFPGFDATLLSQVRFLFNIRGMVYTYIANKTYFPNTFENQMTSVQNSKNKTVLTIRSTGNYNIGITDSVQNIYYDLTRGWNNYLTLIVRGTESFFQSGTGVLVNGCPKEYVESQFKRRRRDVNCSSECQNVAENAENSFINASMLEDICNYDCETSGDPSISAFASGLANSILMAQITDIASINTFEVLSATTTTTTPPIGAGPSNKVELWTVLFAFIAFSYVAWY